MTYILHSYWQSSSAWRVRIALNVKHIQFTYNAVDLLEKQHTSAEFSKLNPMLQIPVLETPSFRLTQSLAIFHYLESVHKFPSMLPSDIVLESKMWEICEIINSGIQPLQNISIIKKIKDLGGNQKEWAQGYIEKGFDFIEKILQDTNGIFCIGDRITFADACLLPQVNNAKRYGVNLEKFEQIRKIVENLEKIPEIQKSLPDKQPDFKR